MSAVEGLLLPFERWCGGLLAQQKALLSASSLDFLLFSSDLTTSVCNSPSLLSLKRRDEERLGNWIAKLFVYTIANKIIYSCIHLFPFRSHRQQFNIKQQRSIEILERWIVQHKIKCSLATQFNWLRPHVVFKYLISS